MWDKSYKQRRIRDGDSGLRLPWIHSRMLTSSHYGYGLHRQAKNPFFQSAEHPNLQAIIRYAVNPQAPYLPNRFRQNLSWLKSPATLLCLEGLANNDSVLAHLDKALCAASHIAPIVLTYRPVCSWEYALLDVQIHHIFLHPNTSTSRNISNVHLSPTKSSIRAIGQSDRYVLSIVNHAMCPGISALPVIITKNNHNRGRCY